MKSYLKLAIFSIVIISFAPILASAASLHAGKIYLQVEQKGEAWYVNPTDGLRYYLGRPADAFGIMRTFGLGISNKNLAQIPIGLINYSGTDSDQDGLPDDMELAIGTNPNSADSDGDDYSDKSEIANWYNPNGPDKLPANLALVNKLKGRILLQVEKKGEAWYLNPNDSKRYFLGRPGNAFEIMYNLGIGISNANLNKIAANYVKTTFEAAGKYKMKYPNSWSKAINPDTDKLSSFKSMDIVHKLVLTPSANAGRMKIYVLESDKDFTLSHFNVSKVGSSEKITDEEIQIGVKPAKYQKFKYNTDFTRDDEEFKKGAEIYLDIMINTKRFIHLELIIFNESDIEMYENYFSQIINDFEPIY